MTTISSTLELCQDELSITLRHEHAGSGETAGDRGETAGRQRRRSGETKKFILFSSSDDVAAKLASVPVSIRRVFHVDAHWTSMEPCQQLGVGRSH